MVNFFHCITYLLRSLNRISCQHTTISFLYQGNLLNTFWSVLLNRQTDSIVSLLVPDRFTAELSKSCPGASRICPLVCFSVAWKLRFIFCILKCSYRYPHNILNFAFWSTELKIFTIWLIFKKSFWTQRRHSKKHQHRSVEEKPWAEKGEQTAQSQQKMCAE